MCRYALTLSSEVGGLGDKQNQQGTFLQRFRGLFVEMTYYMHVTIFTPK